MVKAFISLALIGTVTGTLLAFTAQITQPKIEANRLAQAQRLLRELIPAALHERLMNDKEPDYCTVGLVHRQTVNGYAGPIHYVALSLRHPTKLRLRIVQHQETPGIGDFIDHSKSSWILQLDDQTPEAWLNLDTVSGATITTRAIRQAIADTLHHYEQRCDFDNTNA